MIGHEEVRLLDKLLHSTVVRGEEETSRACKGIVVLRRAHDFVDRTSHLAFCNFYQMTIFDLNKGELASLLTYYDIECVH